MRWSVVGKRAVLGSPEIAVRMSWEVRGAQGNDAVRSGSLDWTTPQLACDRNIDAGECLIARDQSNTRGAPWAKHSALQAPGLHRGSPRGLS
jgi:hypothetical protein